MKNTIKERNPKDGSMEIAGGELKPKVSTLEDASDEIKPKVSILEDACEELKPKDSTLKDANPLQCKLPHDDPVSSTKEDLISLPRYGTNVQNQKDIIGLIIELSF